MALSPIRDATIAHNGKYSSRNGARPKYIVIHHGAVTGNLIGTMTGGREVSAHVVMQDGKINAQVDENHSSWTLGSQTFERQCLTGETQNSTGAPSWLIAEAEYRNWARQVADWSERFAIPCNRTYVLGHGEVYSRHGYGYATACPGGIDVDRIVRDANAILKGGTASASSSGKAGELKITAWPRAIWHVAKGQTPADVARQFGMSLKRFYSLNGVDLAKGFASFKVAQAVNVAVDYAPLSYQYLDIGTGHTLAVAQTQRRLKAAYPSYAGRLVVDGIYGAATRQAVAEFQGRVKGLSRSGRVDRKTWDAIHGRA